MTCIKNVAGGSYLGVPDAVQSCLQKCSQIDLTSFNSLTLNVNIDGLPLFDSTFTNLWPVLGMVKEAIVVGPFVIGIFCGDTKPTSPDDYLKDFVLDMKILMQDGIDFNGQHFQLNLGAFICDAQARSWLKCVKGHTGYSGCERWTQEGNHVENRMIFPEFDAPARTNASFKQQIDDHHIRHLPLEQLNTGLVSQFVLDYMHLVCLGK